MVSAAIGSEIGPESAAVEHDVGHTCGGLAEGPGSRSVIHGGHFEGASVDRDVTGVSIVTGENHFARAG